MAAVSLEANTLQSELPYNPSHPTFHARPHPPQVTFGTISQDTQEEVYTVTA